MPNSPKIAIVGAGPAGLTLASILQKNQIPYTIYDLDASPNERNQGGTLDLHPQDGQQALREAGLWDEFVKHARPESDVMKVVKLDGTVLVDENGPDARIVSEEDKYNGRPEIDRSALKEILLGAVKPDRVQWGKKLLKVAPAEANTYDLHFTDGSVQTGFDLVVGADGAWSRVRELVSDTKPHYSGVSAMEVWSYDVDQKNKWMSQYVGKGSCFSFGEGRTIQIQRLGDGTIRLYACLQKPETFIQDCGIDWTQPDTARQEYVDRYYADCGEDLKRVILESKDGLVPRVLYMLPVGYRWQSKPGVTLLGDAAHLMTPFAGVGVNAAMTDALELARAIVASTKSSDADGLEAAVKGYEEAMFPRGEKFAQKTMKGLHHHFSAGGAEDLAARIKAR